MIPTTWCLRQVNRRNRFSQSFYLRARLLLMCSEVVYEGFLIDAVCHVTLVPFAFMAISVNGHVVILYIF